MKIYTHCSAEVSSDPIPLAIATVTMHDAAKLKAVTIIVEQRTWLKLLGQAHQFGGKLLWFHSYKSFHKYNFHNDYVITKSTEIFYCKNLELYGILHLKICQQKTLL